MRNSPFRDSDVQFEPEPDPNEPAGHFGWRSGAEKRAGAEPPSDTPSVDVPSNENDETRLRAGESVAGRYDVLEPHGFDGTGHVYAVHDRQTGDRKALKVMLPSLVSSQRSHERFMREIKVLKRLRHAGLVRVCDAGEDVVRGMLFLVMEYVGGVTLDEYLRERGGRLEPEVAVHVAMQICAAMEYAHRKVLHLGLNPHNVLITPEGCVKVADAGLAAVTSLARMRQNAVMQGTAVYQAPELAAQLDEPNARADVYSVGVLLYHMLTAQTPTPRLRPPSVLARGVHSDLERVLLRCLRPSPDDRYGSMRAVAKDLRATVGMRPSHRRAWAAALLLCSLVGLGLYLLRDATGKSMATVRPLDADPPQEEAESVPPAPLVLPEPVGVPAPVASNDRVVPIPDDPPVVDTPASTEVAELPESVVAEVEELPEPTIVDEPAAEAIAPAIPDAAPELDNLPPLDLPPDIDERIETPPVAPQVPRAAVAAAQSPVAEDTITLEPIELADDSELSESEARPVPPARVRPEDPEITEPALASREPLPEVTPPEDAPAASKPAVSLQLARVVVEGGKPKAEIDFTLLGGSHRHQVFAEGDVVSDGWRLASVDPFQNTASLSRGGRSILLRASGAAVIARPGTVAGIGQEAETAPDDARQIGALVHEWASSVRDKRLADHLACYAPVVGPYFNEGRATRDQVRADKLNFLSAYDDIDINVRNLRVSPRGHDTAVATFDKEWHATGGDRHFSGDERQELVFKKIDGEWKITAEKELKVYWTNRSWKKN